MASQRIATDTLIAFAAGELDRQAAAAVEAQLSASPADAARLKRIRTLIDTMRTDDSVAPPAAALARAKALFRAESRPVWRDWLAALEEAVARLVSDSRAQPALAGFRSAGGAVQLTFESDTLEVDLELIPPSTDETRWTILGQLSSEEPIANTPVALVSERDAHTGSDAEADEHGVFKLQADPGEYELMIRLPQRLVRIPGITIP